MNDSWRCMFTRVLCVIAVCCCCRVFGRFMRVVGESHQDEDGTVPCGWHTPLTSAPIHTPGSSTLGKQLASKCRMFVPTRLWLFRVRAVGVWRVAWVVSTIGMVSPIHPHSLAADQFTRRHPPTSTLRNTNRTHIACVCCICLFSPPSLLSSRL